MSNLKKKKTNQTIRPGSFMPKTSLFNNFFSAKNKKNENLTLVDKKLQ